MLKILERLYTLINKALSVKGAFFAVTIILCMMGKLDGIYVFVAGGAWVGSRELYKHFLESRNPTNDNKGERKDERPDL
jgi:hypothetical protein